jgi:hypothetical protein
MRDHLKQVLRKIWGEELFRERSRLFRRGSRAVRYFVDLSLGTVRGFSANAGNINQWLLYNSGKSQNPPIFIVGCGHSGTSLLLSILGVHSRIYAIPEETCLAFDYDADQPRSRTATELFLWTLDSQAIHAGKMRWVEKTPKHICAIGTLLRLRPEARIIIIIRDGRDVALSLLQRHGNLRQGIDRWVNDNRAGEAFWKHPNVYKVLYEDLIGNFEATIRKLVHFLGEDYEEQLAHYYETPKFYYSKKIEKPSDEFADNHNAYRNWQINQPLIDSRGKWKKFSEEDKQLIKDVAGDMLIEYGYATDKNW